MIESQSFARSLLVILGLAACCAASETPPVIGAQSRAPAVELAGCEPSALTASFVGVPQPGAHIWLTIHWSGQPRLATLDAWIDFDDDERWDADERIVTGHRLEPGFEAFELSVPMTARTDRRVAARLLVTGGEGVVCQDEHAVLAVCGTGGCSWAGGFADLDLNGNVWALEVFDDGTGDALYAGGDFTIAGQVVVNRVARWDGSQWSALTGSLGTGVNGSVRAMAVYDDGSGPALYAAGYFTHAGGIDVEHVARWDGSEWSALSGSSGTGTSLQALALEVYDDGTGDALYVGGPFVQAGGVAINRIARWNGSEWSALSGPSGTGVDGEVTALATHDDGSGPALFVGGRFGNAGNVQVNGITRWNGTSWSALAGPTGTGVNGDVFSLAVYDDGSGDDLYAGGSFGAAGGVGVNGIARWDGGEWSALTGSSGTGVGGTLYNVVYALEVLGSELYVGGKFASAGGVQVNRVARWDGGEWSAMSGPSGTGTDDLVYAMSVYDDGGGAALVVGGAFARAGGLPVNYVAVWDTAEWSPLSDTIANGMSDRALALAVYDNSSGPGVYVGGDFLDAGSAPVGHVARWTGSGWDPLAAPGGIGTDGPVHALAVYDDGAGPALYVAGEFETAGSLTVNGIARWDGSSFAALGAGAAVGVSGDVRAMAVHDDGTGEALYVGGDFQTAGGITANHIARWDGVAWSALQGPSGTGTDQTVETLKVFGDGSGASLYAGGGFTTAGGAQVNHVAEWTGSLWLPLIGPTDVGTSAAVYALETWDGGGGEALYVGGAFVTAGGIGTYHIARWDGSEWSWLYSPLAIGVDDRVEALVVADDGRGEALFAGGRFVVAGGVIANRVARWDGIEWSSLAGALGSGTEDDVLGLLGFDQGTGPALLVVGEFETAGGIASRSIARWSCLGASTIFADGFESGDASHWSIATRR